MATRVHGRPRATTHDAIEDAAFALFEERGFEATTMGDIAADVNIGRRTLFRYYPSKNDILWGQFDESLRHFRESLERTDDNVPLVDGLRDAVVAFNDFPTEALPQHRRRMRLLLGTPALLGHSELRYTAWRACIAEFVAARLALVPTQLGPVLAGRVTLALSLSAYEAWLQDPEAELHQLISDAFQGCTHLFSALGCATSTQ